MMLTYLITCGAVSTVATSGTDRRRRRDRDPCAVSKPNTGEGRIQDTALIEAKLLLDGHMEKVLAKKEMKLYAWRIVRKENYSSKHGDAYYGKPELVSFTQEAPKMHSKLKEYFIKQSTLELLTAEMGTYHSEDPRVQSTIDTLKELYASLPAYRERDTIQFDGEVLNWFRYLQKEYPQCFRTIQKVLRQDKEKFPTIPWISLMYRGRLYLASFHPKATTHEVQKRATMEKLIETILKDDKEHLFHLLSKHSEIINLPYDYEGNTLLHLAARMGSSVCSQLLLMWGANNTLKNNKKRTPLEVARIFGEDRGDLAAANFIAYWKGLGSESDETSQAQLPPDELIEQRIEIILYMIEMSSPITGGDRIETTEAANNLLPQTDEIKIPFSQLNIEEQREQQRILRVEAADGHEEFVKDFLTKYAFTRADMGMTDDCGETALHVAVGEGNTKCAEMLLEKGWDFSVKRNDGKTPLELLRNADGSIRGSHRHYDKIKTWIDERIRNQYKKEKIVAAVGDENTVLVGQLLSAYNYTKSDMDTKDADGITLLHSAAEDGFTDTVAMLLKAGWDVNLKTDDGKTALDLANDKGHEETERVIKEWMKNHPVQVPEVASYSRIPKRTFRTLDAAQAGGVIVLE